MVIVMDSTHMLLLPLSYNCAIVVIVQLNIIIDFLSHVIGHGIPMQQVNDQ